MQSLQVKDSQEWLEQWYIGVLFSGGQKQMEQSCSHDDNNMRWC